MFDAFISHSSKDKEKIVYSLVKKLENKGIDVWLDANEILAGDTILDAVEKGVATSICTILIITPAFFESIWTPVEMGIAFNKSNKHAIIPVLCDINIEDIAQRFPLLLTLKYIKLDTSNLDICVNELYENINKIRIKYKKDFCTLSFKKAVKKFNTCDTPTANTISILLSEYEQIVEINTRAAVLHASQIAITVIDDLYIHLPIKGDAIDTTIGKLDSLKLSSIGLNENIYEHLKLLSTPALDTNMSLLTNDADRRKLAEMSMTAILEWYSKYLLHNKVIPKDKFEIVWPDDLEYDDFVTMYEIDKLVLRDDLIAPPDITYKWYLYNNYSHIAIRSTETYKIVGYFTVLPVTNKLYKDIQSGVFKDNDLSTENLRKYDIPDFYKLYVACVCIHPVYQNTSAFHTLYNALIKMMLELAIEREIYITDIITEASTLQGEKFCKILGLKRLMDTELNTQIYGATLLPPSLQLRSTFGNKLIKYYKERYEELSELF